LATHEESFRGTERRSFVARRTPTGVIASPLPEPAAPLVLLPMSIPLLLAPPGPASGSSARLREARTRQRARHRRATEAGPSLRDSFRLICMWSAAQPVQVHHRSLEPQRRPYAAEPDRSGQELAVSAGRFPAPRRRSLLREVRSRRHRVRLKLACSPGTRRSQRRGRLGRTASTRSSDAF